MTGPETFPEAVMELEPGDEVAIQARADGRCETAEVSHSRRRDDHWHEVIVGQGPRIHVVNDKWIHITGNDLEPLADLHPVFSGILSVAPARHDDQGRLQMTVDAMTEVEPDDLRETGDLQMIDGRGVEVLAELGVR